MFGAKNLVLTQMTLHWGNRKQKANKIIQIYKLLLFAWKQIFYYSCIFTKCPFNFLECFLPGCILSPLSFFDRRFEGIVTSKIIFPFPWNPYFKTDVTSHLILFWVKDLQGKGIFCQNNSIKKFPQEDDKKQALVCSSTFKKVLE